MTTNDCPVMSICVDKHCVSTHKDADPEHINRCSCRSCLHQNGPGCQYSGNWYNVDDDCLARK